MKTKNPKRNTPWWLGDVLFIGSIVAVAAVGTLWARPGDTPAHRLHRTPPLPYPPGQASLGTKVKEEKAQADNTREIIRTVVSLPPNVTFTCDIVPGKYDGVNVYEGRQPGQLALAKQFGPVNVFPLSLDTNWPHFVEVRTLINWPAPGVVDCQTNEDGDSVCITNVFYESDGADYLWVPAGMTNQWLAQLTNGQLELIGYGAQGSTYAVKRGALNGIWNDYATVTGSNWGWTVPIEGTNGAEFFWTTWSTN